MQSFAYNYPTEASIDDVNVLIPILKTIFKEINYKIPTNSKILIKPNLCGRDPDLKSENTSAVLIEAIIQLLLGDGTNDNSIIIGHTSLLGTIEIDYPFEKLAASEGYDVVAAKYPNVELLNLDTVPQKRVKLDAINFSIPTIVEEVDQYISLTKLKTHMQTTASLSLKNQMGTVSMKDRKMMHYLDVDHYIAQLSTVIRPDLNIIDGILAMQGQGPHHGEDVRMNLLLAGTNMVHLDSLACRLMGLPVASVKYIGLSQKLGSGELISDIEFQVFAHLQKNFKLAKPFSQKIPNLYIWPKTACTGCTAALVEIGLKLDKMKGASKLQIPRVDFILGNGEGINLEELGKVYGIGDCIKNFATEHGIEYLPGCPMSIKGVEDFIFEKVEEHTLNQVKLMFKDLRMALAGKVMGGKLISQGYDNISHKYDSLWGSYTQVFNDALIDQLNIQENMEVLDLACGTGINTIKAAQQTQASCIGIDLSEGMLKQARDHAKALGLANVDFIESDMLSIISNGKFRPQQFDRVLTFWALGYSNPVKVLHHLKRLSKSNAKMAIISNMGESPAQAFKVYMEIVSENPDYLAYTVRHNFPSTLEQFRGYFIEAGYELHKIQFNENYFEKTVQSGKEALEWMLNTGAGALYDDAIKPEFKDAMHELFIQKMDRFKKEDGIVLKHKFVSAFVDFD